MQQAGGEGAAGQGEEGEGLVGEGASTTATGEADEEAKQDENQW